MLLLITILCFVIGGPFVDHMLQFEAIPDILLTVVFIFAIYAISLEKKNIYIGLSLATPMFLSVWSSRWYKSIELFAIGELFGALFAGFVIWLLVKFIFQEKEPFRLNAPSISLVHQLYVVIVPTSAGS